MAAPVYRFTFDSPERALHFVRRVFMQCFDVVTFRDECTVRVLDGHVPPQLDKLLALAKDLGSVPPGTSPPPPLPTDRPSRMPTQPEEAFEDLDVEVVEWDEEEEN